MSNQWGKSNCRAVSFQDVEIGGVRITNNLDTPWAVGQVLNQDSRKISAKDFRQGTAKILM